MNVKYTQVMYNRKYSCENAHHIYKWKLIENRCLCIQNVRN